MSAVSGLQGAIPSRHRLFACYEIAVDRMLAGRREAMPEVFVPLETKAINPGGVGAGPHVVAYSDCWCRWENSMLEILLVQSTARSDACRGCGILDFETPGQTCPWSLRCCTLQTYSTPDGALKQIVHCKHIAQGLMAPPGQRILQLL